MGVHLCKHVAKDGVGVVAHDCAARVAIEPRKGQRHIVLHGVVEVRDECGVRSIGHWPGH